MSVLREPQLEGALARAGGVPPPVVWIASDEPLLLLEAADRVRASARGAGFDERRVFHVDRTFRVDALAAEAGALSLFSSRRLLELRFAGKPGRELGEALAAAVGALSDDVRLLVTSPRLDKATAESAWFGGVVRDGWYLAIPVVERDRLPAWIGDVSRSGENAAVTHAYRAVQRANHSTHLLEPVMKKKIAGGIVVLVVLGLLIAWKSPGLLGIKPSGGFSVVYVDENGKRYEMNGDDKADVEATLAKLPADKAAMMRERIAESEAKEAKARAMFGAFAGGDRTMVISDETDENDPWSQLLYRES